MPFSRKQAKAAATLLAGYGIAALILWGLEKSRILQSINLLVYDYITHLSPAPSGQTKPIVIIGISESDIKTYGWPIDDSLLCAGIDRLSQDGVTAIGLDLYRDKGIGAQQNCLRETIRSNPKFVSIFNAADAIDPIPGAPIAQQGYNDLVIDEDGVVRRDLVHVGGQDERFVTLPMRLLEITTGQNQLRKQFEAGIGKDSWLSSNSGGYYALDAAGYQQMLPFAKPGSYRLWTLKQLLSGDIPAQSLRGTVALIGSTAPSLRDLFQVPHTRFQKSASLALMPGVEIHANRLAALIERQGKPQKSKIWASPVEFTNVLILFAALISALVTERISPIRRGLLLLMLLIGSWLVVGSLALLLLHVWLELSETAVALLLFGGTGLLRRGALAQVQRQQVERLLGQTTSPAVAEQLWSQRETLLSHGRFEGRQLPVTVIFSDTRNFTTVSEGLSPAALLNWLNRCMAYCVPAITNRGGMVNKFTGDGFMAVYGAPIGLGAAGDARAALQTALEIQQGMSQLNTELEALGDPPIAIRLGIHSGPVLAGSMGCSERLEYAVIGDTVNCASRLESLEKERHDNLCRVLISDETRDLLDQEVTATDEEWIRRLIWMDWGSMKVKGREEPLRIWELRGIAPATAEATQP
jgi:adenylate cyclase